MRQSPVTLFHYTSTYTAQLILANHEIWTTDVRFSNDRLEGHYFVNGIGNIFATLARREKNKKLGSVMERVGGLYQLFGSTKTCLALCLSEDGDLLSQWNAYAEQATGVCIGFDYEVLNFEMITGSFLTNKGWGTSVPFVRKVSYGPGPVHTKAVNEYRRTRKTVKRFQDEMHQGMPAWDEHFQRLLSEYSPRKIEKVGPWDRLQAYPSLVDGLPDQLQKSLFYHKGFFEIGTNAALDIYMHKHPGFHQEREWRFETSVEEGFGQAEVIEIGDRTRVVIKHKFEDFPKNPIKSITLGPLCAVSEKEMLRILRQLGYSDTIVTRSEIPLQS